MAESDFVILSIHDNADALPLQYLAAGLLANWHKVPVEVQREISETAILGKVVGLKPQTGLKEDIDRIIRNNTRKS